MKTNKRGFTLIELLVVIAIIAILAAILFPVFARAREQARKSACLSNLKQIGLGVMMYAQDFDETYPIAYLAAPAADPMPGYSSSYWFNVLQPYTKNRQVWVCPTAGRIMSAAGSTLQQYSGGYGYNACGTATISSTNVALWNGFGLSVDATNGAVRCTPNSSAVKMAEVTTAAETILITDPASNSTQYTTVYFYSAHDISYWPQLHGGPVGPFYGNTPTTTQAYTAPSGGGNYLFADGHAKFMEVRQAFNRKELVKVNKNK